MSKRQRGAASSNNGAKHATEVAEAIALVGASPRTPAELSLMAPLTPLEKQVVEFKRTLPSNVVLMIACGYRVKVYGRDSRVVSRRCGIMCIPGEPFEYSSFPYTRVDLYIHRLVSMGYHVAFADQESAAVRAADGVRGGIFERRISQYYSRATLLPGERVATAEPGGGAGGGEAEDDAPDGETGGNEAEEPSQVGRSSNDGTMVDASELYLCFVHPISSEKKGTQSVPSMTLSVILASFVTHSRACYTISSALALEDVLQRYDVAELLFLLPTKEGGGCHPSRFIAQPLLDVLETTLSLHWGPSATGEEDSRSVSVSILFSTDSAEGEGKEMEHCIRSHLQQYKLRDAYNALCDRSRSENVATPVATESLQLPGSTLRALDVFRSSSGPKSTLMGLLDHHRTACGARRLQKWLGAPLTNLDSILARQAVVSFLVQRLDGDTVDELLQESRSVEDAEAVVGKLHAQRCGVREYVALLRMIRKVHSVATSFLRESEEGSTTPPALLTQLLRTAAGPPVASFVEAHKAEMNCPATCPMDLFTTAGSSRPLPPDVELRMRERDNATAALEAELLRIRDVLHLPGLEYRTIAGTSYIVDVPTAKANRVPSDWMVLSRIKTHVRFHTPLIVEQRVALTAAMERLSAAATAAWQERQLELVASDERVSAINAVIDVVAQLDALRSLAKASSRPGYCAPQLRSIEAGDAADALGIHLTLARHPMLDVILRGQYVGCDASMGLGRMWLLTGPNMGGKSALMRMVGVFVIMAQIGCYVPASSAALPVFTGGVFCRMGASDAILEGRSTFLTEMEETSRILRAHSLEKSLVLMDELGRGTSSFDGVAVAAATLEYLTHRRVTSIFVTHYTSLCAPYRRGATSPLSSGPPVDCLYMGFEYATGVGQQELREESTGTTARKEADDPSLPRSNTSLRFLYVPVPGVSPSSFGVEVACLAGLPASVTTLARRLSLQEEAAHGQRQDLMTVRRFMKMNAP